VIARAFRAARFPFRYCASPSFAGKLRRAAMGANRLGFAGLALATGMLATGAPAGCSHAPPAPDAPPCATPEPLRVQLRASARLNPGEKGEALATVVRVYQVKGIGKLTGASFDDLLDHDKDTFGDDLLVVQELTVNPGDQIAPPVARHADANYVVAIALFRQPVGTNWRAVKKLWPANADHCHAGSKGGSPAETRFR
jgi:type VI secretion system protein VasD